jgi:hypothetical protein
LKKKKDAVPRGVDVQWTLQAQRMTTSSEKERMPQALMYRRNSISPPLRATLEKLISEQNRYNCVDFVLLLNLRSMLHKAWDVVEIDNFTPKRECEHGVEALIFCDNTALLCSLQCDNSRSFKLHPSPCDVSILPVPIKDFDEAVILRRSGHSY